MTTGRYLVSELVRGRTLDALERDGALSDRDVLRVGLALAEALGPRARARRDPPRRQAAERDRARRGARGGQADRLRRRPPGRRRAAHAHRRRGRHARLHGARAGGRRARRRARRPLRAGARALRGAGGRQPGPRAEPGGDRAARRHRAARRCARSAATCRRSCALALDRALAPHPDARGTLDELADALADALPEVSDDGGTIAPHPLEHVDRPLPPLGRAAAGLRRRGPDRARRWPRRR